MSTAVKLTKINELPMMSCNEIDNGIQDMIYGPPLIVMGNPPPLTLIYWFVPTIIQESGRTARKWERRELHSHK